MRGDFNKDYYNHKEKSVYPAGTHEIRSHRNENTLEEAFGTFCGDGV